MKRKYQITGVSSKKTVSFAGSSKSASKVKIPSTVTKIGKNAFKNCTSLKSVTVPKNVTSVGTNAFYNCKKLTTVKFSGTKITKIGKDAFANIAKKSVINVPKSKEKAYKKLLNKAGYKKK